MISVKKIKSLLTHNQILEHLFVIFIVIQALTIFLKGFGFEIQYLPFDSNFLTVCTGVLGCLFIWSNRKKLLRQDKLNWKKYQEEKIGNERTFQSAHPTLAKIPFLGSIYGKWFVEPFFYKMALFSLFALGAGVYLYDLSYYNWLTDEPLVISVAKGYLETGTYTEWDFWHDRKETSSYNRAWPHTWLVAQSLYFFGFSEWSARIVSVFLGLLFIPVIYFVACFFLQNRLAALILTFV